MPVLGHVPFVLRGGNVADFLNFNGAVTRTNKSDCSLANSFIFKFPRSV